jgi:hypothetical protein
VFTQEGAAMLSSVLTSKIAVQVNIQIMRAFIEIRQQLAIHPEYDALRATVFRIEAELTAVKSAQVVDTRTVADKVMSLSRDVRRISDTLDEFQSAYVTICRPKEDPFSNN